MAVVFGLSGVPVIEMLFINNILLLIGIFLIFFELKKMKSLWKEERNDMSRFEHDLDKFEVEEKNLDPTRRYIGQARAKGMSDAQITDEFLKHGWSKEKVDAYLK